MPFTTVAFAESLDPAAALVNFAGVPDNHVTVSGDDIYIPTLNQIIAIGACIDLTVASYAQLRSPSLIERGHEEYIEPVNSGLTFGAAPLVIDKSRSPIPLKVSEALQARILSNPGAAAEHYVIVWLADGSPRVVSGDIRTIRCTGAITLAANTWVNGAITFPVSLAAGRYQVVGARCVSTNGVAFRLNFQGSPWRPGGPCAITQPSQDVPAFRVGGLGVWGEFSHMSPPTLEVLGVTDTTQVLYLDLLKVG